MSDTVRYEVKDAVGTITLNRPDAMNALTTEMKVALRDSVQRAAADPSVRAVVLTGAGRAFCAGQDLREHVTNLEAGAEGLGGTVREHYNPTALALAQMPKPVVAAVNGSAAGAGASLAFACDFRVLSEKASFMMAFARVGLGPDTGASWTLQRLVGRAKATELLMLAEPVRAADAAALGLATSVVPPDDLAASAHDLAARLAAGPTVALGAIKQALDHAATNDLATALEEEAELQERCGATDDHRAATYAFVRKETPVFEGR
ncbi:MAG TPA: enoyl-CoA hydratase-related protein [Streptosporangiaceae bacterium]